MTNIEYLNKILDENYIEIGKSGRKFNKNDVITDLSSLKELGKLSPFRKYPLMIK